ncbi:DNA directed RNA polymerase [Ochromonadaceae sp. CCMP2298]|nr:DNA directed RNA polymerase [Ochromonadaceae sp. CCMP2298]
MDPSGSIAAAIAPECTYLCGACGTQNGIKPQDPIRCRSCGYRILYKTRTKRMIQFEAR